MSGGFYLRITSTRFEFFVTADGRSVARRCSGRVTGLLIIQTERPRQGHRAAGRQQRARASPACSLEITAGRRPDGPANGGVRDHRRLLPFEGQVQVMFNTTLEEQVFEVPESFLYVLPDDYPTQIRSSSRRRT